MRHLISPARYACKCRAASLLILATALTTGGCDPALDTTQNPPRAGLPADVGAAMNAGDAASGRLDAALAGGTPAQAALATLLVELQQDPAVAAAAIDSNADAVWVVFRSGVQYTYEAIDLESGYRLRLDQLDANTPAPSEPEFPLPAPAAKSRLDSAQTPSLFHAAMPGNHRAVLASSIAACAPEVMHWSSDNLVRGVKPLLERLGYVVFSTPASLDFFERLSQRQCSVVFIDARGWLRNTDEMLRALSAPNLPGTSGLDNTRHMLMTSTAVTSELEQRYSFDLANGRLVIRNPKYRQNGKWFTCGRYFGVTPAFVRAHDTGRYPDRTILILNAGNMVDVAPGGAASEWYTLLKEKSSGAVMVGWAGEPAYPRSVTAMANLLELATGAEFRYLLDPQNNEVNTEPIQPPVNLLDMATAVAAPTEGGTRAVVEPGSGVGLLLLWDELGRWGNGFSLAPQLRDLYLDRDSNARLFAATTDHALLQISTDGVSGSFPIDIGVISPTFDWRFKIPLGTAGPMTLRLADGRHSRALTLFTWKPQFTTTGAGPLGLTYRKTYQMVARGVIAPRWRGVRDPNIPWSLPQNDEFIADFDSGGCIATWSVSGGSVQGNLRYTFSGGGSKPITFPPGLGAGSVQLGTSFAPTPGGQQTIDAIASPDERFVLEYTETVENTATNEVQTHQRQLPYLDLRVEAIPVDAHATLEYGSRVLDRGSDYTETVAWPACVPSPGFDPLRERR